LFAVADDAHTSRLLVEYGQANSIILGFGQGIAGKQPISVAALEAGFHGVHP
jgi:hypothetical protein